MRVRCRVLGISSASKLFAYGTLVVIGLLRLIHYIWKHLCGQFGLDYTPKKLPGISSGSKLFAYGTIVVNERLRFNQKLTSDPAEYLALVTIVTH